MAKLTIGDKTVTVDDSFRSMSPEQQNAAVEEIASSLGLGASPQDDGMRPSMEAGLVKHAEENLGRPTQGQSFMLGASQGATANFSDEAASGLNAGIDYITGQAPDGIGAAYDKRLGDTRQSLRDAEFINPGSYLAGQVAGGVATAPALPVGSGIKGGLAAGAAYGAASGAGAGEGAGDRLAKAGTGALVGGAVGAVAAPVAEAAAKGVGKIANIFGKRPPVSSLDDIAAAKTAAYKASEDAGVVIKPSFTQKLSQEVKDDLANFGYRERLQPGVKGVLDELDDMAGQNVTLKGMDGFRQVVGMLGKSEKPAERELARQIIKKIDKKLDGINVNDVLMGDARGGVESLQMARKLHSVQRKSEMIQEAIERAKNQAGGSGSGGNIDNALRQQFKRILQSPKLSRGLTPDERATMQLIVRGVKGESLLRAVSKLSPNGNGLMTFLQGGGLYMSGGATLPMAGAGIAAKLISDPMTARRVAQLEKIVRLGGNGATAKKAQTELARIMERVRPGIGRASIPAANENIAQPLSGLLSGPLKSAASDGQSPEYEQPR